MSQQDLPAGGNPLPLFYGKMGIISALLALLTALPISLFHLGNPIWGTFSVGITVATFLLILSIRYFRLRIIFDTLGFDYRGQSIRYQDLEKVTIRAVPALPWQKGIRHRATIQFQGGSLQLDARLADASEPAELFIALMKGYCPKQALDVESFEREQAQSKRSLLIIPCITLIGCGCVLYSLATALN